MYEVAIYAASNKLEVSVFEIMVCMMDTKKNYAFVQFTRNGLGFPGRRSLAIFSFLLSSRTIFLLS